MLSLQNFTKNCCWLVEKSVKGFKGTVHPKIKTITIYSTSCRYKQICCLFSWNTHKKQFGSTLHIYFP